MTEQQSKLLIPGDLIIVSTSDGCGGAPWGTIVKVEDTDEDGVHIEGNIIITDVRRIDIYRKLKSDQKLK